MDRFDVLHDAALLHRVERLQRTESDLQQTAMAAASRIEAEGRWPGGDPVYRHLSYALKRIRKDLLAIEHEYMRRSAMKRAA